MRRVVRRIVFFVFVLPGRGKSNIFFRLYGGMGVVVAVCVWGGMAREGYVIAI